jgi:hypothetical protein
MVASAQAHIRDPEASMFLTARRVLVLVAVIAALAAAGCGAPATPAGTATPSQTPPAVAATPTVESLKGAVLSQRQEGLVFDYLVAGGLSALESRFGKPAGTYRTAADEASTGSAELTDGRAYRIQCGLDEHGAAVVMAHGVEAKQGQSPTAADTAFLKAMVDGETTLPQANAYLKKTGAPTVRPAVMDPKGLNVTARVWALEDGSGFMVVDLSTLTAAQQEAIGVESAVPFQALYWDASRWSAY